MSSTQPGGARTHGGRPPEHPVVTRMREHRTADLQLRLADVVTRFAGSMRFVWLHAAVFAVWMLVAESNPWPTLTLVVSLEAIFLSTFVMIGQNRQAAFAKAKADHDFAAETLELRRNTELTREVHRLTVEVHRRVVDVGRGGANAPVPSGPDAAVRAGGCPTGSTSVGSPSCGDRRPEPGCARRNRTGVQKPPDVRAGARHDEDQQVTGK